MNRRSFFQMLAGVVAGLCGAGAPGKAEGVCSKPVYTRTMAAPQMELFFYYEVELESGAKEWRKHSLDSLDSIV